MTYPYSDADMEYNFQAHRYILTDSCVRRELNLDLALTLNTRGLIDRAAAAYNFLNQISRDVYAYLYSLNVKNDLQEYLAAKHPNARRILRDAMLEQVLYVQINGDLTKVAGIDVRKGTHISRGYLNRASIAPVAEQLLSRPLDDRTPALAFRGCAYGTPFVNLHLPAYESEGY